MTETLKDTHAWQTAYERALENFFNQTNLSLSKFIEIIFVQGTLDRMAPEDLEIRDLRLQKGSQAWKGTRDDAELYWRMIYAIESSKYAIAQNWSVSGSDYSLNVINATMRLFYHPNSTELCQQLFPKCPQDTNAIIQIVMRKFQEKVIQEMQNKNFAQPDLDNLLQTNDKGKFYEMPVYIDRIQFNGSFWLQPTDREQFGRHVIKIGKLTNCRGATPLQMHTDFILKK
ncbi:MAG: hypothetical protein GF365_02215 [Candidatus Buchananbacteria bacterium]|nr:hypothetical protein [Candidatus Buchananbacteria bacterium]